MRKALFFVMALMAFTFVGAGQASANPTCQPGESIETESGLIPCPHIDDDTEAQTDNPEVMPQPVTTSSSSQGTGKSISNVEKLGKLPATGQTLFPVAPVVAFVFLSVVLWFRRLV